MFRRTSSTFGFGRMGDLPATSGGRCHIRHTTKTRILRFSANTLCVAGPDDLAVEWLLASHDPSVRYFTLTDLLNLSNTSHKARKARKEIPFGPRVRALLAGQRRDGGFGVHPYQKWTGAHWRLVSLIDLGMPERDRRTLAAIEQVLRWLGSEAHARSIMVIRRRTRRHASQEGNALRVCCCLGMARDPRVERIAESLVETQWPDGGWNCDHREEAVHSSFYESLTPLWGLIEFKRATGFAGFDDAIRRAAEFFLRHRLFRSDRTGRIINLAWLTLHYPLYWHYDVLQGLRVLSRLGLLRDPRAQEALDLIEAKRRADGRWRPGGYYWSPVGASRSNVDVVNWGRRGPNEMITLNALRVLKVAGRTAVGISAKSSTRIADA